MMKAAKQGVVVVAAVAVMPFSSFKIQAQVEIDNYWCKWLSFHILKNLDYYDGINSVDRI